MKKGKNNGITLVGLVVTIIVLLILAGITINLTIGEGGIIKRAQEAGKNYTNSADYERVQLSEFTNEMDNVIKNTTSSVSDNLDNSNVYESGTAGNDYIILSTAISPYTWEDKMEMVDENEKSQTYVYVASGGCGYIATDFSSNTSFIDNTISHDDNRTTARFFMGFALYCKEESKDKYLAKKVTIGSDLAVPEEEGYTPVEVFFTGKISAYQSSAANYNWYNKITKKCLNTGEAVAIYVRE